MYEKTARHITVVKNVVYNVVYNVNLVYSVTNEDYENTASRYRISEDFSDELFERTGFFLSDAELFNFQEFPDPTKPGHMMIVQTWRVEVPSHHWKTFNEWIETLSETPSHPRGWFRKWLDNKFLTMSEKR